VFTIEIIPALADQAAALFRRLGYANIRTRQGDGWNGWPEEAPFDAIVVTAAADTIPPPLLDQLKDGGRLLCILGSPPGAKAMLYRRSGTELAGRAIFDAAATLLPGFAKAPAFAF
jgi:protein-L-isoaspartate(D-aspartate) O-methyltransferase